MLRSMSTFNRENLLGEATSKTAKDLAEAFLFFCVGIHLFMIYDWSFVSERC